MLQPDQSVKAAHIRLMLLPRLECLQAPVCPCVRLLTEKILNRRGTCNNAHNGMSFRAS